MKKILSLILALIMVMSLLAGCGDSHVTDETTEPIETEVIETVETTEAPDETTAPATEPIVTEVPEESEAPEETTGETTGSETAHKHNYKGETTKAATCTSEGVKTYTCSVCGATKTESIAKTAHDYKSETTKAATCTAEGSKTYTCKTCGYSYKETVKATGHSYDNGKVTKTATCTSEGVKTYTCSVCGATKTESIAKTAHKYVTTTVAPTTDSEGYDLHKCSVCGDEYKDNYKSKVPEETKPTCTEHEYEWVCDSSWEFDTGTCKNCGAVKTIYASSSTTSQAVVDAINAYRVANGLGELQYDSPYDTRIKMRAAEIREVLFSHIRPDGSQSGHGECCGSGYSSAQAVVDAWYNSSSHNGIIMDPDATRAAAAYNGSYWVVWIM